MVRFFLGRLANGLDPEIPPGENAASLSRRRDTHRDNPLGALTTGAPIRPRLARRTDRPARDNKFVLLRLLGPRSYRNHWSSTVASVSRQYLLSVRPQSV